MKDTFLLVNHQVLLQQPEVKQPYNSPDKKKQKTRSTNDQKYGNSEAKWA
jgi:hypothetical protein